jgi:ABC-type nitrate/sulfonate/bicarbonate transport system ATPase subunit
MLIEQLNFSYNSQPIFEDFDFQCQSSLILLMGPSGCGKTTLLKIIGKVFCENITYRTFEIQEDSYLILQDDALCPWLSGIDNIIKFFEVDLNILKTIPLFKHTETFINKKACALSFGERRMIELLRAIVFKPKLLLLDEPFNYLDYESRKIISTELIRLIEKDKTSIVFTSHYNEDFGILNPIIFYFPYSKPISKLSSEKIN